MNGEHWYTQDGRPFYEIAAANGNLRAVTLRDARKVLAVPSVTTVLGVIAKPQLEAWKVRQGILAALTLPKRDDEPEPEYLSRINLDSQEQAKAAAQEGNRIHDACECAMKGLPFPDAYRAHVAAVRIRLDELFPGVTDWIAEKSFAHDDGYGGKVDLHSPSTGIVVDYKGKDGDFSDGKKLAYDQHWQLGGYRRGLSLPRGNVAANLFVSRTHPGKVAHHVWTAKDVDDGEDVFLAALSLWKRLRNYDPAQLRAAA
jgi:hypothetical protein